MPGKVGGSNDSCTRGWHAMKQAQRLLLLVILGVVSLGCGLPGFVAREPEATPAPVVPTLRPTFTATLPTTDTPSPTPTLAPTDTPLPTDTSLPPTETPLPPTATPLPPTHTPLLLTDTPVPPTSTPLPPTATKAPPKPTVAPTAKPAAPKPKHVVGSHGVSGLVVARDKTTFAVGEKAWFVYEALNHTQDAVGFELLGIKASNGQFNTSWINPDFVLPDQPFRHDDGLVFDRPGTYQVMLAICFARCGQADADWEEFPKGAATITVK
jgi:hypothetical protein